MPEWGFSCSLERNSDVDIWQYCSSQLVFGCYKRKEFAEEFRVLSFLAEGSQNSCYVSVYDSRVQTEVLL